MRRIGNGELADRAVDLGERLGCDTIPEVVFFSSRRRHTRLVSDWSSDVCSSDLRGAIGYTLKPNKESPIPIQSVSRLAHQLDTRRPLTRRFGALESNTGTPSTMQEGSAAETAMNSPIISAGGVPAGTHPTTRREQGSPAYP